MFFPISWISPFHRSEYDALIAFERPRLGVRTDGVKTRLHRLGRGHHLGKEELPSLELRTDEVEYRDEDVVDDRHGVAIGKQFERGFLHLFLAPRHDEAARRCNRLVADFGRLARGRRGGRRGIGRLHAGGFGRLRDTCAGRLAPGTEPDLYGSGLVAYSSMNAAA